MSEAEEFVNFQVFGEKMLADALANFLTEKDVAFQYEDNSSALDANFGGGFTQEYAIRIRPVDFDHVNTLLREASETNLEDIPEDYYLFSFTEEELRDVVSHSDEWSPYDYLLAQKLLADRGIELSHEDVVELRQQRIAELSKPEKPQTAAIAAGYFFAFAGGIFGILIGWYLNANKRTLPNGERVYTYSHRDRKHGLRIMVIGIGVLVGALVYRLAVAAMGF